jgi:flagellar motor switch protein FliN/FliY
MHMSEQVIDPQEAPENEEIHEQEQSSPNELALDTEETLTPLKGNGLASIDMLMDVVLQLSVELGRTQMSVRQVLDIQKGSVVELNRVAGDAVDVYVNDHLIARGEVVVVEDKFGVRITELISPTKNGKDN